MQALPLDRHYHVSSTNFVHILSPFGNELIKYNLREEQDAMHEIKIRVLHKVYKQVLKQLYSIIMPIHAKQERILTRDHKEITNK
jgi:hypothetical protein